MATSLTLLPRGATTYPASLTFGPDRVVARLGPGHVRVYRHGVDVDALALRRPTPGVVALDLLRGGRCVARVHGVQWQVEVDDGPRAAEVTGLPLHRDRAVTNGLAPPLAPDTLPRALALLTLVAVVAPLLVLVLGLLDAPVVLPLVLALLLATRTLAVAVVRRPARVTTLYRARPIDPVPRAARTAALVAAAREEGRRWLVTRGSTRALPPAGDLLAPASLHDVTVATTARRYLQVRAADGRVLASLEPRLWCGDGPEELATALGLREPGPPETVVDSPHHLPRVTPDLGLPIVGVTGGLGVALLGLAAAGPAGVACAALGLLVAVVELATTTRSALSR